MLRWPYKFRIVEGNKYPWRLGGIRYRMDLFFENLYIRLARIPKNPLNTSQRDYSITISLTTFPARIDKVYYAIKSLMIQSMRPDRIVLWLAEEQFSSKQLPASLKKLQKHGLDIKYCDDLKSHKKYYYSLLNQSENELVITYDDDIIYEYNSVEKLVKAHLEYPDAIICNRGLCIRMHTDKELAPYKLWLVQSPVGVNCPSPWILASTGYGCLYPPNSVPPITFSKKLIRDTALSEDDLWMKFCTLSAGRKVVKTAETNATLCVVYGTQKEALTYMNNVQGENDRAVKRLSALFPGIFEQYTEN